MTTYTYDYEIKDVDQINKTMVVEYLPFLPELSIIYLNIPIPTTNSNIDEWVNSYAPQTQWQYQQNLLPNFSSLIGQKGTLTTSPVIPVDPAETNSIAGDQTVVEGFNTVPANTVIL